VAASTTQPHRLLTGQRTSFGLLLLAAAGLGYYGIWEYVNTERGAGYGRNWWDIAYYDLQLFVLGSKPLEGPGPFNPALEVARYLAAATTVFAVVLAASALFGNTWRRWRQRRLRGHAIVVGATPEARAIAARRVQTMPVVAVDDGDVETLRGAGIAGASVLYACGEDRSDVAANLSTALAAASLRRSRDLRIEVHVTDPTLALGLKARRLMMDDDDEPVIDFFSMDEMAARRFVEAEPFGPDDAPSILVAGAGVFGQAVVVEFVRQWRRRSPRADQRLGVTLVDDHAGAAAERLRERWPELDRACDITTVEEPLDTVLRNGLDQPYRAYFCYEDEHRALGAALSAAALWRGGPGSVVVRLSQLARHGAAFEGAQVLLDGLGGRLRVVNVPEAAVDLVLEHRDPVRNLAEAVHENYLRAQQARGVAVGSTDAMRPWAELSEDIRASNRAQARAFTVKLQVIGCTLAPASVHLPAFELRADEVETLAVHEHDRWMAERAGQGWQYGGERDNKRKRHPDLVPWSRLTPTAQEKDREAVRNLPTIYGEALALVGLQIVRLTGP
jgi:hypothetical protein